MLAKLLGKSNDRLLLQTFTELETAVGNRGIDAKLVGDILKSSHFAIKALRLDSADSTPLEVYNALRANVGKKKPICKYDYVGVVVKDRCISLNEKDVAADDKNNASFSSRSLKHMQVELKKEIILRYKKVADGNRVVNRLLSSL